MLQIDPLDREALVAPLFRTSWRFWVSVAVLLAVIAGGSVLYVQQVQLGLGQTGMQRPVYWGIYMVNFVFFIGVSLAGTLISAILRITGVGWRRPITRIAEAVTVFALVVAGLQIMIDMGRPDRLLYVIFYGRLQSPIIWDVIIVTVYLLGSSFYLYLPLIPDVAIVRDNLPVDAPVWRRILYRALALGWRGNVEQWRRLEKAVAAMALFIIPVAISVHTITSWILATTVQPGWHSTVFGPYFVVTAIFSGISALFVAVTAVRQSLGLPRYITLRQYHGLGLLFITMGVVWGYFTYTETLTLVAGQQTTEFAVLASKLWGGNAISFWLMIALIVAGWLIMVLPQLLPGPVRRIAALKPRYVAGSGAVAAGLILVLTDQRPVPGVVSLDWSGIQVLGWAVVGFLVLSALLGAAVWFKKHPVAASVVAGIAILMGTWLERWNIIVPTVTRPRLIAYSTYTPTLTEIGLSLASVALFILLFVVFFKLFPAVSIWEVAEGRVIEEAQQRVVIPSPQPSAPSRKKRRWQLR
jgi:Ni/Fe-hydrogenase subunit HybB-like protein